MIGYMSDDTFQFLKGKAQQNGFFLIFEAVILLFISYFLNYFFFKLLV